MEQDKQIQWLEWELANSQWDIMMLVSDWEWMGYN